jgi:hypothetical protein
MLDPTREEQVMKRTAVVIGIAAVLAVAPQVASAGNVAQVKPQVAAQVVQAQVAAQVVAQRVVAQRVSGKRVGMRSAASDLRRR